MAVAVLLLVLEGVLDSSGWVLRLFGVSPGKLYTLTVKLDCTSNDRQQGEYWVLVLSIKSADRGCDVAVQLSIPTNIVTIITSLLLFKLAQVAIVYAAAGVRQANASVRRQWGAQGATGTSTRDGELDIPTAGTRCATCTVPAGPLHHPPSLSRQSDTLAFGSAWTAEGRSRRCCGSACIA